MTSDWCFFDGKVILRSEARVDPTDLGMLRGFAVYEGITSFNGIPFHFTDHWKRMCRSADLLSIRVPLTEEEALAGAKEIITRNAGTGRAHLRVILSGGPAEGGLEYVPDRSLFYMLAEKAAPLPEELFTKGGSLITVEHERFMPECKTTTYITAVKMQPARKEAGAIEVLYVSKGEVLECATSNICIVKDGKVITPKNGVLLGITRAVVLELAEETGIATEERKVTMDDLYAADEIFITSSFKDIVPIVSVDGRQAGGTEPGPVTRTLIQKFNEYVAAPHP
jgi:branched-chain amino acid aminotransferase